MRTGSHVIDHPPPVRADESGGGGGWAWLLTASGAIEAHLVRGVLEDAGVVPVALDASDPSPMAWLFLSGNVNAPVRVFVPASLLDDARLALLASGVAPPHPADPPARASRPARPWMVLVLALLVIAVAVLVVAAATGTSATCVLRLAC